MKRRWLLFGTAAIGLLAAPGWSAEYNVASASDVAVAEAKLRPGDTLVLADGIWKDQVVVLRTKGVAGKPITLRAATPGKVILTGKSSLHLAGDYLVASGLCIRNGSIDGKGGDAVALRGSHCRLTDSAVIDSTYKFDVHLYGTDNRVDHCYLAGKTSESPTLQVEVGETPNNHRIDHNQFGPRPPLGKNGGETMRVGYSGQSMRNSRTIVEYNLFDRCDGELEIISSKSCENTYRFNTFIDCAGMLTLRHGNRCRVENNIFLGHHKRGSGGIRIIGDDHVVTGNYIDGVELGGFWITSGIPNSPLAGYYQTRNARITNNTVIDSHGPYLQLDAGIGTSGRTLRPENITITNNLLMLPTDTQSTQLLKGIEGKDFQWKDNVVIGASSLSHTGLRTLASSNVLGTRDKNGMWRPAKNSGLSGIGAETAQPLTTSEAGPSWKAAL